MYNDMIFFYLLLVLLGYFIIYMPYAVLPIFNKWS